MNKISLSRAFTFISVFFLITDVLCQEEVLAAVSELKKDVATMEYILDKINRDVEKDDHKSMEKSGHDFELLLGEVKETGGLFRDEIRNELNSLANKLGSDLVNFEKTVHKSRFLDAHKDFENNMEELNTDFLELKQYIDELEGFVNEVLLDSEPDTVVVYRERPPVSVSVKEESSNSLPDNSYKNSGHSYENSGSLKLKCEHIGIQMNGIENAFKYDKFSDIAGYCSKISDLCEEMKLLSPNSQVAVSVSELSEMAHEMEHLALQGHSKHDQIHHEFDHMKKLHKKINASLASE